MKWPNWLDARAVKVNKPLFYTEMILSPLIAAIALLVQAAANWGLFGYLPAVLWLVIFVQCLFAFKWRGLWFLLGPLVAFLAIVAYLAAAPPVSKTSPVVPQLKAP